MQVFFKFLCDIYHLIIIIIFYIILETIEKYIASLPIPSPSQQEKEDDSKLPSNSSISSPATVGARLSNNARIQRFVVSKMAGSSVGQDVLVKVVGQDFQEMIDCLTSIITKCNENKFIIILLLSSLSSLLISFY